MTRRVCGTRQYKVGRGGAARPSAAGVAGPLFHGTIYVADLELTGAGGPWSVAPADLSVVARYLSEIVAPVASYASQYGPTGLTAGRVLGRLSVPISQGSYSDADLQGWVNELVGRDALGSDSAVLVLNPPGAVNRDAKESGGIGVLGYHGFASVPYSFVNLLGTGLAPGDRSDLYAEAVSHEVAEMTVDPRANDRNPEVCDGCGTNCLGSGAYRAYFASDGRYLESATTFPPSFAYAFFLAAIARPAVAADCPAPAAWCAYPPPTA